jgi:hypothetical protein
MNKMITSFQYPQYSMAYMGRLHSLVHFLTKLRIVNYHYAGPWAPMVVYGPHIRSTHE